jgi:transposase
MRRYAVHLQPEEREQLLRMTRSGRAPARQITRAHILLKADEGMRHDVIAEQCDVSTVTVTTVCGEFQTLRVGAVERKRPQRVYARKLDGEAEAYLIALACSAPPAGRVSWTLRLLRDEMVRLGIVGAVSHETVRQRLKKTS